MSSDLRPLFEPDIDSNGVDPDETPVRDRKVVTQPYDLVVQSLIDQIADSTLHLRPLSDRPSFQRRYVWDDRLASRLIESILLNVPIPPCYLSQNEDFELDVIDGQQRIYSIYRFVNNQFHLTHLTVMSELNGRRFHELPKNLQRQIQTHTLRCTVITNQSHPEIKFDVFERLNTNTVPLNAQELRNCIYRGGLNDLLGDAVAYEPWLRIIQRKRPDTRMRDEELILRFFAFYIRGVTNYRTPLKYWLNDVAKEGMRYDSERLYELESAWKRAIDVSLIWFSPTECFRTPQSKVINRALFDLVAGTAARVQPEHAASLKSDVRSRLSSLLTNDEFVDLIKRSVDHKRRTVRRFELWSNAMGELFG